MSAAVIWTACAFFALGYIVGTIHNYPRKL